MKYNTGIICGKYKSKEQRICAALLGFQTDFSGLSIRLSIYLDHDPGRSFVDSTLDKATGWLSLNVRVPPF